MGAQKITDAEFENEVLKAEGTVLVDFWAEWCGPCKSLLPSIDALADEKADKIKVVKVNVDENPDAPGKYGVRSIPALFIFKDGEILDQKSGSMPKSELDNWVESNL